MEFKKFFFSQGRIFLLILTCSLHIQSFAQERLITNVEGRKTISLNGKWQYIIDPYETGYYNYRWQERNENDREAYWNSALPDNKTDRKEHGWTDKYSLEVPGDWNAQAEKFLYYEGTVWYRRSFDIELPKANERVLLHFGAVNYRADVYLNGRKLGFHAGGFTAFNFEIPRNLLKARENSLVVKVDNKRHKDEIPTLNTDWWNYGGITRDVNLVMVPEGFIMDYSIQLARESVNEKNKRVEGWIKFSAPLNEEVNIEIPELKLVQKINLTGDSISFQFKVPRLMLWSTTSPKVYQVVFRSSRDTVTDKIGFRAIEVQGKNIVLNGKRVFLRGISIHEEIPGEGRRAHSKEDALRLLRQAKELSANMVRLAHYPHNEYMLRMADSLGLLVWSEIPVYWTINFRSDQVLRKAKVQLEEMIGRDRNRASIIIWSVGNETPVHEARTEFMRSLIQHARQLDQSRLISAALEVHNENGVHLIDDPLGAHTDIVAVNEYLGWYGGLPNSCRDAKWVVKYDKPLFFSETGAEAPGGFHADME